MSEFYSLPESAPDILAKMTKAGHKSVFDIIKVSRAEFIKTIPDVDQSRADKVYRDAHQRAATLKSYFRSWQLRQEPVISGLKKLAPARSDAMNKTLVRNISGDGDFSDLMARSSEYADAASIQSLFSPGRYVTALYAVAKKLYDETSALAIDKRRPDLHKLVLSEISMSQEVSSLDVLLDVLTPLDGSALYLLPERYFPMTLPYDDNLHQINASLGAQGRSLNGIWEKLTDTQRQSLTPSAYIGSAFRRAISQRTDTSNSGKTFYLKANNSMVWLSDPVKTGSVFTAHMVLGEPDARDKGVAPLRFTVTSTGSAETMRLGLEGEVVFSVGTLKNAWLTGSAGQQNAKDGRFAALSDKTSGNQLSIAIIVNYDDSVILRTSKGWIGIDENGGNANRSQSLVLNASKDNALKFTLCADQKGREQVVPALQLPSTPPLPAKAPNPPTRTTLSLTPLCYQLLLNNHLQENDIQVHYGLSSATQLTAGQLAKQLNDIPTFCQKTGLTFNQLLELTAQTNYRIKAGSPESPYYPDSRYSKFGQSGFEVEVHIYGAAFLNATAYARNPGTVLWVQPEVRDSSGKVTTPAALNFRADTVITLAGDAEKLIRLRNTTGLSFEMLDWIIVNASRAAGYKTPSLDANTLQALAAYVGLTKRYSINANTFCSFIGAINPYCPEGQDSEFQRIFASSDGIFREDLVGLNVRIGRPFLPFTERDQRAIFCKAAGVTDDELTRILKYCDLKPGDNFDEYVAGRICRFGAIPRMLGLTFAEAECLWMLLDGMPALYRLGAVNGLYALDLISRSEQLIAWMAENSLSLIQLQAMVSRQHSDTATPEMFIFLQNIYNSVNDEVPASRSAAQDSALRQKLLRALAGGFGMKTNVTGPLTDWLAAISDFTLSAYWADISQFFADESHVSVDLLQRNFSGLVMHTHRLSQLVVITRWLDLSEQDLTLLTATPTQLDATLTRTPQPDLPLLLLLSRFKRWQSQVTVTSHEALRLLPLLAAAHTTAKEAAAKIATLHNLSENSVQSLGKLLFGKRGYPADFAQLWQLLNWTHTGQMLNVGSATLKDLLTMTHGDEQAEQSDLIARVAQSLTAGLTR
ncbi:Tc toxin subunit A [Erwinia pyrifoliae]|uniref:Tc toxin subunit A n=1 Tax=Erwinia pyrifoliae TaxID=79967 RepID=UPI0022042BF4|nr:Tc toxin subunit A [Erwinia pyrifoliae]UWS29630.1 Tc toxin subunit A [Erwinia pyrifoliae]